MDWFSWLSKTSLDPSLVYEYGISFAHNELEEEDIAYFNHEFLQSMGISIAKHRLEILKLAKRERNHGFKHPMSKLLLVLKKTKKSLTNYIARLSHKGDDRALIVFPNHNMKKKKKNRGGALSYSSRWRRAMMINNNNNNQKLVMMNSANQDQLMITNGDYFGDDPLVVSTQKLDSFSSPMMHDLPQSKEEKIPDDQEDEYWTPVLEEIRWDAMFQDLKPT